MNIKELLQIVHEFAPIAYQESYDNSGLQIGDWNAEISGALLCLDITDTVLDEAIALGFNLIISHHPLIFKGLKQLTGANSVQQIVQKAIKNEINIIAVHTNLDNMYQGVNYKIAQRLGLKAPCILSPMLDILYKLQYYVPESHALALREHLFTAGAGHIGQYTSCSFAQAGKGTFKASVDAHPFIGSAGGAMEEVNELKVEMIVPQHLKSKVETTLLAHHPYEEVAFDWIAIKNKNNQIGAGMIAHLDQAVDELEFLKFVKEQFKVAVIRHSPLLNKKIQTVAFCGGSGSFLISEAIKQKADIFITADMKYHQFFDAEAQILIADIGHYESEQFTVEIFHELLLKKNITFAVRISTVATNPVKYFY